eukprot:7002899-Prorocentrum_lima.AAC.1
MRHTLSNNGGPSRACPEGPADCPPVNVSLVNTIPVGTARGDGEVYLDLPGLPLPFSSSPDVDR